MKKLLFTLLLLCSSPVFADYAQDWNKRFSELNPGVPVNSKWAAPQQQRYLRELLQRAPLHYKNPDDYPVMIAPVKPVIPAPVKPGVVSETSGNVINRIRLDLDLLENMK